MEANTIRFVQTKGGHITAIINGQMSVVKREEKEPQYALYRNVAKGVAVEPTPILVAEFTDVYYSIEKEAKEAAEKIAREERERKEKGLQDFKDTVRGMTPADFAEFMNLDSHETAGHWNDLYTGRSSFAVSLLSHEEYNAFLIAKEVNGWDGHFVELRHRSGEHHHNVSTQFGLEDYQRGVATYFNEKYFYKDQEMEEEFFLERVREAETMDEVLELTKEFNELEAGYYDHNDSLVLEGNDFDNVFGYSYDVYTYRFGFNFPSKSYFNDGPEEEEVEEDN